MRNLEPLVSIKDINTSIPEPLYAQYEKHNGKGTWKELYDWAIKYAEAGYAPAQESLGRYFLFCNSSIDYKQAVVWLMRSAEQGFASGQFNLGWCYEKGKGVAQNYTEAVSWYRKAANQGHPTAQNNLGVCYREGKGVEQDYVEAIKWYRKAADQGHPIAQNNLGFWYQEGKGVEQDFAEAVKWYRKAAEQGLAAAQNNLGWCYEEGKGIEQDYAEAVNWYRKAAEQGNPSAQYNLGLCFEEGKGIPNASFRVAVKWYTKATEQNYTKAQIALGTCYQEGKGVQKDYVKAMELFEEALVLGDGNAKAKIDCLNNQIDAERKAQEEAERKAREEAERKAKEEAERKAKEEAERIAKEEAESNAMKQQEKQFVEHMLLLAGDEINVLKDSFIRIQGKPFLSRCSTKIRTGESSVIETIEDFYFCKIPVSDYLLQVVGRKGDCENLSTIIDRISKLLEVKVNAATIEQMEYILRGGPNVDNKSSKISNSLIKVIGGCHITCSDSNYLRCSNDSVVRYYKYSWSNECGLLYLTCSAEDYEPYYANIFAQKAKKEAKRIAKEEAERIAKEEAERKAKEETERIAKEEAERKAKEVAERIAKEEAERKAKEEADRIVKEEAERKAKEEAERIAKEEAERIAKEEAERKAKEETERIAKEEAERIAKEETERIAKEEAERKATEEAERKATEEAERKAKEEAENRLAEYRRLREANDDEFKTFCKDLLAKRAKAKSVGMLWKKSEEFEILTMPLTYNIFNSFRTGVVCTKSENETLMDQFKDKKDIALLIEKMGNAYKDEGVTFTIPSSREIVGAQSAKVVGKEGVYLVCHFPEFEE